jgi:hypothetical protein
MSRSVSLLSTANPPGEVDLESMPEAKPGGIGWTAATERDICLGSRKSFSVGLPAPLT